MSQTDGSSPRQAVASIGLRPIASPVPVTLLALAVASLVVCGQELGWYPLSQRSQVGWLLIAFPVPIQLISMAWAFVTRSAVATASAAVLAATWLATGLGSIHNVAPPAVSKPLAVLQLGAAACLVLIAVVEAGVSSLGAALVFGLAAARFILSGLFGLTSAGWLQDAAGIVGLVIIGAALYVSAALMLEGSLGRDVLPTGRRGVAGDALGDGLERQLEGVAHEPGVRRLL